MLLKKGSLPLQLLAVIGLVVLFGDMVGTQTVRFFYTFSLLFKEVLSTLLPFIIFSFVLTGILSFKKNAPIILLVLLGCIFCSNSIIALCTYGVARLIVPFVVDGLSAESIELGNGIVPYVQWQLPSVIRSEYALLAAIVFGLFLSWVSMPSIERGIKTGKRWLERFLNELFIPLLPLYVFGFLLEMNYKGVLGSLFAHYGTTFICIVAMQIAVLFCYYWIAAAGTLKKMYTYITNALPSYITAFSTMSSTATIPVSIEAAEKNTGNKPLAELAMPIMANIHLTGDSVSTPLLALVSSLLFLGTFPDIGAYLHFVLYFCTAMLAVSGIPGGGIIVMVPVLVSQFHFTQEMVGIIMALYLLLDAFGTAANVMGDGALVILVHKLLKKMRIVS